MGITNQRETTVVWDTKTGEPLHNAMVWPDTRTKTLVRELRNHDGAQAILDICGLPLSTYPSSVKLLWLIENVDAVGDAYDEGRLAFGTVDSWLIYKLNGGAQRPDGPIHVTDGSNASRTMFMNLHTLEYDDRLIHFFGLDREKVHLPKIVPSSDDKAFGCLTKGALKGLPIAGCLGDQSSALVGQCGFKPGQAKNTYGTGCFLLYNTGTKPVMSKSGLLATVAYDFGRGREPVYALEGSIATAGAGVKFLSTNLGFADDAGSAADLAETVSDNGGVYFVTAFSGLFAPYWIDDAKGTLCKFQPHPHNRFCPIDPPLGGPPTLHTLYTIEQVTNTPVSSRHHATHAKGPHRAGDARGDVLPDQGDPRRHGARLGAHAREPRRRRRALEQRPVHADAGGRDGHPRRAAGDARDDGVGSGHRGGDGDGRVGRLQGPGGREPRGEEGV